MNTLFVIQHTEAEFLGLLEDHLEGRGIRFRYVRPFVNGAMPDGAANAAGLILLGGGPWGSVSKPVLPSLDREVALARDFLERGRPVIGFGLGAQVLTLAQGGAVAPAPLRFTVGTARRVDDSALGGHLPASWPLVTYMRDRPLPPPGARVLAVDDDGEPAVFQVGLGIGFAGHPGVKAGMVEDLIMEFADTPEDCGAALERLRLVQDDIRAGLADIAVGLMHETRWMEPRLPIG